MRYVIAGGTGQLGRIVDRALTAAGHDVTILTRGPSREREVYWDAATTGPWTRVLHGSDVVLNLAGRSVGCRYTDANLRSMMDSRVRSAEVIGQAISESRRPPALWLQMSTATIYAHRYDAPNDEATGVIGGRERGVPGYWAYSVLIARNWERVQEAAPTPYTRKVALRSAMVMSPDPGGVLDRLLWLARLGLSGPVAGGNQYVSWIHDEDFVRALEFLTARTELSGPVNLASPGPVPQREFMRELRTAWGRRPGLPATAWMAEIGAFALRADTELLLKSRRVVPGRLLEAGFDFRHPHWPAAARDLVHRVRGAARPAGGRRHR
ncbi:epimerase [Streptomyces carpaticus]|uniref:Epimerase n=1 Tax=Streptomyces carpaticus TaxID=285558 RepID=A0ABV4ZI40_9ACTN